MPLYRRNPSTFGVMVAGAASSFIASTPFRFRQLRPASSALIRRLDSACGWSPERNTARICLHPRLPVPTVHATNDSQARMPWAGGGTEVAILRYHE